ncbi:hypothetical protein SAY87_021377 [Trapa incisa]|uniref:Uncharacterized protein n=1 Tax=Trapa incisa TaxID=236973 RepID=A0AAN7JSK2_9MYRT|nr:hypothetical protein SAY87_021377 [Trapa incisa]
MTIENLIIKLTWKKVVQSPPLILPETRWADPVEVEEQPLSQRLWVETKKLGQILGPAIFSQIAAYCMNIISQAFDDQG